MMNLVYIVKEHESGRFDVLSGVINKEKFKSNSGVIINTKNLNQNEVFNNLLMARMEQEARNYYKNCA